MFEKSDLTNPTSTPIDLFANKPIKSNCSQNASKFGPFCAHIHPRKLEFTLFTIMPYQIWRNVVDLRRKCSQHYFGLRCKSENFGRERQNSAVCWDKLQRHW